MLKNVAGQSVLLFAFNRITNAPVLGDGGNITANISLDGTAASPSATLHPTETEDGYYLLPVAKAETNANTVDIYPESTTPNVQVIPANHDRQTVSTTGSIPNEPTWDLIAYASGNDLITRYDIDLIGDLCQDNREELDWKVDIDVLTKHPNVLSALEDGSGEIEAAMQSGARYTVTQLRELAYPATAQAHNNTRKHLIRITCAIAMSMETADWLRKTAKGFLDQLRRGENVFGIAEVVDAGSIDITTVEAIQIENLNLLTGRMPRYFPGTEQRTPRVR